MCFGWAEESLWGVGFSKSFKVTSHADTTDIQVSRFG